MQRDREILRLDQILRELTEKIAEMKESLIHIEEQSKGLDCLVSMYIDQPFELEELAVTKKKERQNSKLKSA